MSTDPSPDWIAIVAERKIKEAMDAGKFDNLEGKGEPLDLSENPFETAQQRVINRILKNSGALPEWAQVAREIQSEIDTLRPLRERGLRAVRFARNVATRQRLADRLRADYEERLRTINTLILKYNYTVPGSVQRPFRLFRVKEELSALETEIQEARL